MSSAGDELSRAACTPAFPWDEAMRLGLSRLRLSPAHFWQLTLRELFWLAGGPTASAAMPRDVFTTLLQRFPDEGHD